MPNEVVGFKINGSTYEYDHEHLANLPTIDATPTANSTNAVQSGGVYSALDGIQAEIPTVDSTPTQGSNNAVSSGGVWEALQSAGLSEDVKVALLACFEHVAWTDEHGQNYYDALESALYADQYPKITATFNSGTNTIYTDDDISSLKQYLTVKYFADGSSAGQIISANDYTLTGTLTEGTSTIFVAYNNLITAFAINDVVDFYNKWNWSKTDGDFDLIKGTIDYFASETNVRYTLRTPYDTRRGVVTHKGLLPYRIWGTTDTPSSYYPIPIPSGANRVTISITPSTQYIFTQVMHIENGNVNRLTEKGWTQGVAQTTFTGGENNALFFNCKYDSSGSSYPTEPTEVTVLFEEV